MTESTVGEASMRGKKINTWRNAVSVLLLLVVVGGVSHVAAQTRIEALDGGVIDLGALTQIIATGDGVALTVDGEGSSIDLGELDTFIDSATAPGSSIDITNGGVVDLGAASTAFGNNVTIYLDSGGQILAEEILLQAGSQLQGHGTISGDLVNQGAVTLGSGDRPVGTLSVSGAFTQASTGALTLRVGANQSGNESDLVEVGGPANLAGTLIIDIAEEFLPLVGSRLPILTSNGRTGGFDDVDGLQLGSGALLTLDYTSNSVALLADGPGFLDMTGPAIAEITYAGGALVDGMLITQSAPFIISAADPSGLVKVEVLVNGRRLGIDHSGINPSSIYWPLTGTPDGSEVVTIAATDSFGNVTSIDFGVVIQLAAPGKPSILIPDEGLMVNVSSMTISGTADAGSDMQILLNGEPSGIPFRASPSETFSGAINLHDGLNTVSVVASNRGGASILSDTVTVTYDATQPGPANGLIAKPLADGVVRLVWSPSSSDQILRYVVYRSSVPFSNPDSAQLITPEPLAELSFDDVPPGDGHYFYRVLSVNRTGTRSDVSTQVEAFADSVAPAAADIQYTSRGKYDPERQRFGVGVVDVSLTVSEPLLTTPFFSLAPNRGVPITVALRQLSDTEYRGSFDLTPATPAGVAYAIFSARDQAGNRGTEILGGESLLIDTVGPAIDRLTLTPGDPIKNDVNNPAIIDVVAELSEPLKAGEVPNLSYEFSQTLSEAVPIALRQISETVWQGSIPLTGDIGAAEVVLMTLAYEGIDDLENFSSRINGQKHFQIYQGELPPQPIPKGLVAKAIKGGEIQLDWKEAPGAMDYQLFRQSPNETDLTPLTRTEGSTQWTDSTTEDGLYRYSVASVRQANGQEAVSVASLVVTVNADSTVPAAPQNLALQLLPIGIHASWEALSDEDELHYRLYRADTSTLTSVEDMTPAVGNITGLEAVDTSPSALAHTYVVTAVDNAGNESLPSSSTYLNFDLLPISSFSISQKNDEFPQLEWTHPSTGISGFDLFLAEGDSTLQLNSELLTESVFEDVGYSKDSRRYSVVAIDSNGEHSLARELTLPAFAIELVGSGSVLRGEMNRLRYRVTNLSLDGITAATLEVSDGVFTKRSEPFSAPAGETATVDVIIGGSQSLPASLLIDATVQISATPTEHVRITRTHEVQVLDGSLVYELRSRDLIRGGIGEIQFTIENTSDVEIEVITARDNGQSPSDELRFHLLTQDDENVLAVTDVRQVFGTKIITLPNGTTVARIGAGERFESDWLPMTVPRAATAEAVLVFTTDRIHHNLGQDVAVSIEGGSTRRSVALIDTPYTGAVTEISPVISFGDRDVQIQGMAKDRVTEDPLPDVPLNLVIASNGFERTIPVFTDNNGAFSHGFQPNDTESGNYTVSSIHPRLAERPDHGRFTIERIQVSPAPLTASLPRNVEQAFDFSLQSGRDTAATNVRLVLLNEDQPLGALPEGLSVSIGEPVNLQNNSSAFFSVSLQGNATTDESGSLFFRVLSDEGGNTILAMARLNYRFSDAAPFLMALPTFAETGVVAGSVVAEQIILSNQGLSDLEGGNVELTDLAGNAAPSWVFLTSVPTLGTVAVGEERTVEVTAAPHAAVTAGQYEFELRITSSNAATHTILYFVTVASEGIGSVVFHMADIYTATLDEAGHPVPGLAGATIRLQNEDQLAIDQTLITDSLGETLFEDLPVGRYRYRASAPNHLAKSGYLWIKAGLTVAEEVFLDYELVSVEWSVTEIAIEDRYQVVLDLTYETDVPAPVVVIEPAVVNLPPMARGDVFHGEFSITNYGLIRADDVRFRLPGDTEDLRIQLMSDIPTSIGAKDRYTVPYRVIALSDSNAAADGDAGAGGSGGGCGYSGGLGYRYVCANGSTAGGGAGISWIPNGSGGTCGSTFHVTGSGGIRGLRGGLGSSGCAPGYNCPTGGGGGG